MSTIFCETCGYELPYKGALCPKCGSKIVYVEESLGVSDLDGGGLDIKGYAPAKYHSKKRGSRYKTFFLRKEFNHSLSEMVLRLKSEDRLINRYREIITRSNGEIIRNVDEKLTDHIGHGSAKKGRTNK